MDKKTTRTSMTITADSVELSDVVRDGDSVRTLPSKSTIAFIRQFARAYSYQPVLGGALGSFVAN